MDAGAHEDVLDKLLHPDQQHAEELLKELGLSGLPSGEQVHREIEEKLLLPQDRKTILSMKSRGSGHIYTQEAMKVDLLHLSFISVHILPFIFVLCSAFLLLHYFVCISYICCL